MPPSLRAGAWGHAGEVIRGWLAFPIIWGGTYLPFHSSFRSRAQHAGPAVHGPVLLGCALLHMLRRAECMRLLHVHVHVHVDTHGSLYRSLQMRTSHSHADSHSTCTLLTRAALLVIQRLLGT